MTDWNSISPWRTSSLTGRHPENSAGNPVSHTAKCQNTLTRTALPGASCAHSHAPPEAMPIGGNRTVAVLSRKVIGLRKKICKVNPRVTKAAAEPWGRGEHRVYSSTKGRRSSPVAGATQAPFTQKLTSFRRHRKSDFELRAELFKACTFVLPNFYRAF